MSSLRVTTLRGRSGNESPSLPDGAVVTGVTTSTSFSGDLTGNATGLSGTPNIIVGVATASTLRVGTAVTVNSSGINVVGVVTATSFIGNGSGLTGLNIPVGFTELDAALFN